MSTSFFEGERNPAMEASNVWTIGYSNRSAEEFLRILKENGIETLVDVRRFPTSRVAHFKREEMERWLPEHGVKYVWLGEELGGYRRGGYERYMETQSFKEGLYKLLKLAERKRVCIMCKERNPKHCHRRFIAAQLERLCVKVIHIIDHSIPLTGFLRGDQTLTS